MSIVLKACPKCGGDVERPHTYKEEPSCIQCGFVFYENAVKRIIKQKQERLKLMVANG